MTKKRQHLFAIMFMWGEFNSHSKEEKYFNLGGKTSGEILGVLLLCL